MGIIADALAWEGSKTTLSLFIIAKEQPLSEFNNSSIFASLCAKSYVLEDDGGSLYKSVLEYDFILDKMPPNLDKILEKCLCDALSAGADVAWFAFEGSFDFQYILTAETANQTYAVGDAFGVCVASDSILMSKAWRERIVQSGAWVRAKWSAGR